jgi:folate-binding protein YgfZ
MERARIAAGIPAVPVDIGPADLPNEGGLEVSAVCFTKGCFLGQEVMARLKNLGQVRRRLHVVRGFGLQPQLPASLYQGSAKIGELRSVVPEGGGYIALAMLAQLNLNPAAGLSLTAAGPADIQLSLHE